MSHSSFRLFGCVAVLILLARDCTASDPFAAGATGLDGAYGSFSEVLNGLSSFGAQIVQDTDSPATLTVSDLRESLKAARSHIDSIELAFLFEENRYVESPSQRLAAKERRLVSPRFSATFRGAISGSRYYIEQELTSEDGTISRMRTAFDGTITRSLAYPGLIGGISSKRGNVVDRLAEYLCHVSVAIGDDASYAMTPAFVPFVLQHEEYCRILPHIQLVDGHACHAAIIGQDIIWIDSQAGFSVRRRVSFQFAGNQKPACLARIDCHSSIDRVDENVWLPRVIESHIFVLPHTAPTGLGTVAMTKKYSLQDVSINNATDSTFDIAFPPATRVVDLARKKVYFIPEGEEQLESMIAEGADILDDGSIQAFQGSSLERSMRILRGVRPGRRMASYWIWAANVALAAIIALTVWYRNRRAHRAKDASERVSKPV